MQRLTGGETGLAMEESVNTLASRDRQTYRPQYFYSLVAPFYWFPYFRRETLSTQLYINRIHIKSVNINFYLISSQYVILVCEYLFIDIYCRNDSVFFRCLCFGALPGCMVFVMALLLICHTLNMLQPAFALAMEIDNRIITTFRLREEKRKGKKIKISAPQF